MTLGQPPQREKGGSSSAAPTLNEEWAELRRGDLLLFHDGRPLSSEAEVRATLGGAPTCGP